MGKWYVVYEQYIVSPGFATREIAEGWLDYHKSEWPNEANEWENHEIKQVDDAELADYEAN